MLLTLWRGRWKRGELVVHPKRSARPGHRHFE